MAALSQRSGQEAVAGGGREPGARHFLPLILQPSSLSDAGLAEHSSPPSACCPAPLPAPHPGAHTAPPRLHSQPAAHGALVARSQEGGRSQNWPGLNVCGKTSTTGLKVTL